MEKFTQFLFEYCILFGLLTGLYFANANFEAYQNFISYNFFDWLGSHMTLDFLLREPVITGLFGVVMAEILLKQIKGEFDNKAAIIQPIAGAIGGVLVPMGIFIVLIQIFGYEHALKAALVVAATDLVFSLQAGQVNRSAKVLTYLGILAVMDDIIIIVASFFIPNPSHPFNPEGIFFILLVLIGAYIALRKLLYIPWQQFIALLFLGAAMWNALLLTGLHPILSFVLILPFVVRNNTQGKEKIASGRKSLKFFEKAFDVPVKVGLFGFGFVAGGIQIHSFETFIAPFTLIVVFSILVGKTIGIPLFGWMSTRFFYKKTESSYTIMEQLRAGNLGAIGFTVSILMAQILLKDDTELRDQATLGAALTFPIVYLMQIVYWIFKNKIKNT